MTGPTRALGAATSTPGAADNKDLGPGVTADSIKIGFAVVDYDAIKDFVDYNLGDEKKVINTIDGNINKNGGIDGRKIVPDIEEYPPIPYGKPDPLSLCTSWAEDDDVFAVFGHGRAVTARQLHREVEERGRRHRVPRGERRLRQAGLRPG